MPVQYILRPDLNLLYYAACGHVTGAELLQAEQAARLEPLRKTDMAILVDLQADAEIDLRLPDLIQGVELNRTLAAANRAPEKTAFVVRSDQHRIPYRVYAALAGPLVALKMSVFQDLEPALRWLGLAPHLDAILTLAESVRQEACPEN